MQFQVIEITKKTHTIEVTESWPDEHRRDPSSAKKHLKYAIKAVGMECITAKSTESEYTITVDGEAL